jgi:hypothetical protein
MLLEKRYCQIKTESFGLFLACFYVKHWQGFRTLPGLQEKPGFHYTQLLFVFSENP